MTHDLEIVKKADIVLHMQDGNLSLEEDTKGETKGKNRFNKPFLFMSVYNTLNRGYY